MCIIRIVKQMDAAFGREGEVFRRFSDVAGPELEPVSVFGDYHGEMGGAGQNVPQVAEPIPRTMQYHEYDGCERIGQPREKRSDFGEAVAAGGTDSNDVG